MEIIKNALLAFIPLFVAVDAIGVLPMFLALTQHVRPHERKKILEHSMVTAFCVAIGFILLGNAIFRLLGISIGDFMVAGGVILFCLAIVDIILPGKERRLSSKELGAVPLGTPLIVGPAVLTTSVIIIPEYGVLATLIAVILNILIAGIVFSVSGVIVKGLGDAGIKALSKVMALFLAAIAVMMIRKGISTLIPCLPPM